MVIEGTCLSDWRRLSGFHYRSHHAGASRKVFRLRRGDELCGVIVYTYPPPGCGGRHLVLPGRLSMKGLNLGLSTISRIVIHPKYRIIGLGATLIRETLPRVGTPCVEMIAVMAKYNPFAEKAGMKKVLEQKPSEEALRIAGVLSVFGFDLKLLGSQKHISNKLQSLSPEQVEVMLYRLVYVPAKGDAFKAVNLGIPTYGDKKSLDESVYEQLRIDGEISEKISSVVLASKYLTNKKYAKTKQIYDSLLRTPGEERPNSIEAVAYGIREGVRQAVFGLGIIIGEEIDCRYYPGEMTPNITFEENEVIVDPKECIAIKTKLETCKQTGKMETEGFDQPTKGSGLSLSTFSTASEIPEIQISINVPRGQVSQIMGLMNFLQQKYQSINLQIKATDGAISDGDLTDHIKETLKQLGIDPEKSIVIKK